MNTRGAILVEKGLPAPTLIPLWKKRLIIGSHPGSDIVFGHKYVSRQHAVLTIDQDSVFIADLRSKNGTQLNGKKVGAEPLPLETGSVAEIARGAFTFKLLSSYETVSMGLDVPSGDARRKISIDDQSRTIRLGSLQLKPRLSSKQFDLLHAMFKRSGELADHAYLKAEGWPEDDPTAVSSAAIRTQVGRIRSSFQDLSDGAIDIVAVRNRGYILRLNE